MYLLLTPKGAHEERCCMLARVSYMYTAKYMLFLNKI